VKVSSAFETERSSHGISSILGRVGSNVHPLVARRALILYGIRSWARLIRPESHRSSVIALAENGCKIRIASKTTPTSVALGHAWRHRLWDFLLKHPWTSGPLLNNDPNKMSMDFRQQMKRARCKLSYGTIPHWTFTSSDLTAATDYLPHDVVEQFIVFLEINLLTSEQLNNGEQLYELRMLL
jgi:hypothetical protein